MTTSKTLNMTPVRFFLAAGFTFCAAVNLVHGQQAPAGKYSSSFEAESKSVGPQRGMPVIIGVELEIASTDGDKATGTWRMLRGGCAGDYAFSGSYQGNRLQAKTAEGSKKGCGNFQLDFLFDGAKLTGTFGRRELVLTK